MRTWPGLTADQLDQGAQPSLSDCRPGRNVAFIAGFGRPSEAPGPRVDRSRGRPGDDGELGGVDHVGGLEVEEEPILAGSRYRGVEGTATLHEALAAYRATVLHQRVKYRLLESLQAGLVRLPVAALPSMVRLFASGPVARIAQRTYWNAADPNSLEVTPGVRSATRVPPEQCATGPAAGQEPTR